MNEYHLMQNNQPVAVSAAQVRALLAADKIRPNVRCRGPDGDWRTVAAYPELLAAAVPAPPAPRPPPRPESPTEPSPRYANFRAMLLLMGGLGWLQIVGGPVGVLLALLNGAGPLAPFGVALLIAGVLQVGFSEFGQLAIDIEKHLREIKASASGPGRAPDSDS